MSFNNKNDIGTFNCDYETYKIENNTTGVVSGIKPRYSPCARADVDGAGTSVCNSLYLPTCI